MNDPNMKLAMIYASARTPRFGDLVGSWLRERLWEQSGIDVEVVDPREHEISFRHEPESAAAMHFRSGLDRADGCIVVTPEYNHSYPAALKALLDLCSVELQAKPIAFVSYGGISGGLRAVEHLRLVVTEMHAVCVRDGVSFANPWKQIDDGGQFNPPPEAEVAFTTMLSRLMWWMRALQTARATHPYNEAS